MSIRILLADDHPLIRAGLRSSLAAFADFQFVGEATNGEEAQSLCLKLQPDILLLDLHMPGPSAAHTISVIQKSGLPTKIIILTAFDDPTYVRELINLNISGYVLKEEAPETLQRVIRVAMLGDMWLSKHIIDILSKVHVEQEQGLDAIDLSKREMDVLRLVGLGYTNEQIVEELKITQGTVKNHITHILDKLGIHSRAQAVAWAWQNKII